MRYIIIIISLYAFGWGCDSGIQRGEKVQTIIIMTGVGIFLRTDLDFLNYHANNFLIYEHVKDVDNQNTFVKMGFNMVTGFLIDSMHTMISGAFLRRLDGSASNPLEGKLSSTQLAQVEKRLKFYRHCPSILQVWSLGRFISSMWKV